MKASALRRWPVIIGLLALVQTTRLTGGYDLLDDSSQSFIMLTIVLEMLFGSTAELTYRISRGVGIFLSNNREEMRKIVISVKRLYNLRSKYVHEGKHIPWDELFELREIVRKTIVLMYEREMYSPKFNFKNFSEESTYDGYLK